MLLTKNTLFLSLAKKFQGKLMNYQQLLIVVLSLLMANCGGNIGSRNRDNTGSIKPPRDLNDFNKDKDLNIKRTNDKVLVVVTCDGFAQDEDFFNPVVQDLEEELKTHKVKVLHFKKPVSLNTKRIDSISQQYKKDLEVFLTQKTKESPKATFYVATVGRGAGSIVIEKAGINSLKIKNVQVSSKALMYTPCEGITLLENILQFIDALPKAKELLAKNSMLSLVATATKMKVDELKPVVPRIIAKIEDFKKRFRLGEQDSSYHDLRKDSKAIQEFQGSLNNTNTSTLMIAGDCGFQAWKQAWSDMKDDLLPYIDKLIQKNIKLRRIGPEELSVLNFFKVKNKITQLYELIKGAQTEGKGHSGLYSIGSQHGEDKIQRKQKMTKKVFKSYYDPIHKNPQKMHPKVRECTVDFIKTNLLSSISSH